MLSGIIFSIVLFSWPLFMALFQPTGSEEEQLNSILSHLFIYKLQFINAFLIGPSLIYMMLVQLQKNPRGGRIYTKMGKMFLALYLVSVSISYGSQFILFPGLLKTGLLEQTKVWYFGSFSSIPYFFNQLGYFFWALGALLLFSRGIRLKGMLKYLSLLYVASAILSILAFVGFILHHKAINSMTLISGLLLIPTGVMTFIWGFRERPLKK